MRGRYVDSAGERYQSFVSAAKSYPDNLSVAERANLISKPFDHFGGHVYYINGMYQLLNILNLVRLPRSSIIADIGGGSGWVSEILLQLGYRVLLIEPSRAMIDVMFERVANISDKLKIDLRGRLDVVEGTIEEFSANSHYNGAVDLGLFMESFHHVVDEHRASLNALRLLKPGGSIGICGESRWHPGNVRQASEWEQEMRTFGTLESPFTSEYLENVLVSTGFAPVSFFHAVNGLFNINALGQTLDSIESSLSSKWQNNVLASKPTTLRFPILNQQLGESCEMGYVNSQFNDQEVNVTFTVRNTGNSVWLPLSPSLGHVTIACLLMNDNGIVSESSSRATLPQMVEPGELVTITHMFPLERGTCSIELIPVAEHSFWFDQKLRIEI